MRHQQGFDVTFGDCDPAGIVFYPNAFRWMDATFHGALRPHGGHKLICKGYDAVGIGLVDAGAEFHQPMHDGDRLTLSLRVQEWSKRALTLVYKGQVNGARVFTGREVRCLFKRTQDGIVAADLAALRAILEEEVG